MIAPETGPASEAHPTNSSFDRLDSSSLLAGAAIAVFLAVFSFHPQSWGLVALGIGLAIGLAMPLSGLVGIALTITTLPLVQYNGIIADVRADELLALVVIVGFVVRTLLARKLPRNELVVPVVAFLAIAAASMALRFALGLYHVRILAVVLPLGNIFLRLLLLMAVAWFASRTEEGISTLRVALVAGGVLGALFGIAQSLIGPVGTFIQTYYPSIRGTQVRLFYGQRAFAAFDGNPNHFAVSMLLLAILALAASDRATTKIARRGWLVAALPMLFAMAASGSRGTYIVGIVVFAVMWLWQKRGAYMWALVALVGYTLLIPNVLRARLVQLVIVRNGAISPESDVVRKVAAWAAPFGRRETLQMTDNFYMDILVNFWPIALLAFLWVVYVAYRRLSKEYRSDTSDPGVIQAALVAWVSITILSMNGAFFRISRVSEILWMILGLAWAWFARRDEPGSRPLHTL